MDTIGPMTKTVKDSAYVLQSIAGVDPLDNYTSAIPSDANLNFIDACKLSALSGARLGMPRNVISLMSDNSTRSMIEAFDKSSEVLRSAGAVIIENTDLPAAQEYLDDSLLGAQIMGGDFVVNVEQYLSQLVYNPHNIKNLVDLREWTQASPLEGIQANPQSSGMQRYKTGIILNMASGVLTRKAFTTVTKEVYWEQSSVTSLMLFFYHRILPGTGLRLWAHLLCLFQSEPCQLTSKSYLTPMDWCRPLLIFRKLPGVWACSCTNYGFRFGFSFLGAKFTEAKIIGLAYAFEQRTMIRKTINPYIKPEADLHNVLEKQHK